jgi:hypothetical protein
MDQAIDLKCDNCEGTEFTLSEGFYYCIECGIRTNTAQQVDYGLIENYKGHKKVRNEITKKESKVFLLLL